MNVQTRILSLRYPLGAVSVSRQSLIRLLQKAYSGELAAALAYCGHWKAVTESEERRRIQKIEAEEWIHRDGVGRILASLGAVPDPFRERKAFVIGCLLARLCRWLGWFAPMYVAGFLESKNIGEYETAARFAIECGHPEFLQEFLTMAEVEWDHESYFRSKVLSHFMHHWIPIWSSPPTKEKIRSAYSLDD